MWNLSYHAKSWCYTGAKHWHQTVSIWHFKFQFNVLGSIFNNFLKYFERRFILLIVINFLKKIHQAICSTIHHSLSSFPLHFACLLVDLSWNINYVDKFIGILIVINQKPPKDITEGILFTLLIQFNLCSCHEMKDVMSCNNIQKPRPYYPSIILNRYLKYIYKNITRLTYQ